MRLLVVSGLSGSGKSIVLQALEDQNFYCVDNLPVGLLQAFAEQMLSLAKRDDVVDIAVGIDARNVVDELPHFEEILNGVKALGYSCEVVFLEAVDAVLLKRFSETRRKHPLTSAERPLSEAIHEERKLLGFMSIYADLRIDTSYTNVHQLRDMILERVADKQADLLALQFSSFGYKYGIPSDADFVFDVRCLPNPHWDPRLRESTGKEPDVIAFLEQEALVVKMFDDIRLFLSHWIPYFMADNRSYMTVAIGCTGGQHRSVYLTEKLAEYFDNKRNNVLIRHRELA